MRTKIQCERASSQQKNSTIKCDLIFYVFFIGLVLYMILHVNVLRTLEFLRIFLNIQQSVELLF